MFTVQNNASAQAARQRTQAAQSPIDRNEIRTECVPLERIDFTKQGRRQFARLNRKLGARFLRGFILRHELAEYIAAHENSGVKLDAGCQGIHYDGGIYLTLTKMQGAWYITEIWSDEKDTEGYAPVFFWTQVKRGFATLLAHVLIGWRRILPAKGAIAV